MADYLSTKVTLGTAFITDKGDWAADTAYEENDIVHTSGGVYMSLADDNTAEVTDTSKWRQWLDTAAYDETSITEMKTSIAAIQSAKADKEEVEAVGTQITAEQARVDAELDKKLDKEKIVCLTDEEYEALETKDADTLYFTTEE